MCDSAAHVSVPRALCSLLETWLQRYPGHFYQAHDLSCLKKLATYAWTQMPYSDLEFQALELLTQLVNEDQYEELVAELEAKAEPEGEECWAGGLSVQKNIRAGPHWEEALSLVLMGSKEQAQSP